VAWRISIKTRNSKKPAVVLIAALPYMYIGHMVLGRLGSYPEIYTTLLP
jgi:hypothetical protein